MFRIESFLSARLFLQPQIVGEKIYFLSNISGHISLYRMNYGGSVPEPLLPPNIALQNPHLIGGKSFCVFPKLHKILVMIDKDGDENYQPMLVDLEGGYPQPAFDNFFAPYRVHLGECDLEQNIAYFSAESRQNPVLTAYQGCLDDGNPTAIGESAWGSQPVGATANHQKIILMDGYSMGDDVLYLRDLAKAERELIYGKPLEMRQPNEEVPLTGFFTPVFSPSETAILLGTTLFSDTGGLGYIPLDNHYAVKPVSIEGIVHQGTGEFENLDRLRANRYLLRFNIDGCSWLYEGVFDEANLKMQLTRVLCGQPPLSAGVLEAASYDAPADRYALAFSTATSPTQIYTIEGDRRQEIVRHTNERILGIPDNLLSAGEDASFDSFDGTRVSARLYLPVEELSFSGPRPLVYYIHGGPQGQERPDYAWFSMPLIQYLTLNGFAVFVPNVRGSTGYGLAYTKKVDRDWGGDDRLDHVHALTQVLPKDSRLDCSRAGVVGRSYGGYMSLTMSGRHTELWKAAVDMFGPYDLITFLQRIPETWKPYFSLVLGDPSVPADNEFLVERSPRTHLDQIACPLLVIQGKNDPRVVEQESRDLVNHLREIGKTVDYLMFENEGHDVLKFENRVTCYNAISDYFTQYLKP